MKKLENQNIYFDFIFGRTFILRRDKVSNKKSMYFDGITSIINLQKRVVHCLRWFTLLCNTKIQ
jgi:hypothetical protein